MSYDTHCYDLAELFLFDEPLLKGREAALAQHIQDSLEDWISYERDLVEQRRREEAERGADRMMVLLDIGLDAVRGGDGDAALLALQEALATAETLPKKLEAS
jgi:hypothetical protein